jgi:hypothetical protein
VFSLTDVQIFNKAIARIGENYSPVIAVDGSDTSKYGTLAGLEYYSTRNEELRSNNWVFATRRLPLVLSSALNLTGYTYCYLTPVDCLRVISIYSILSDAEAVATCRTTHVHEVPFVEEEGLIYTDLKDAYVKYVRELPGTTSITGTTTIGSTSVTACTTTIGIVKGYLLFSASITVGTIANYINSLTALTMNLPAIATGPIAITIFPLWYEPLFTDALAIRLAMKLVSSSAQDMSGQMAQRLAQEYSILIQRATILNAVEQARTMLTADRKEGQAKLGDRMAAAQQQNQQNQQGQQ